MRLNILFIMAISFFVLIACGNDDKEDISDIVNQCDHSAKKDGVLVSIGNEYAHAEFTLNKKNGTLTVTILDNKAEDEIVTDQRFMVIDITKEKVDPGQRVKLTFELRLRPVPMQNSGNKSGSSKYSVDDKRLIGVSEFDAVIRNVIIGKKNFEDIEFKYGATKK